MSIKSTIISEIQRIAEAEDTNLPPLTEKDLQDIALGVELKVDFVALSFARKKSDLQELRRVLKKAKSRAQVVAKIEDQSAVRHIGVRS